MAVSRRLLRVAPALAGGRGGHYRVYKDATLTTTADNQPRKIKTMSIPTNYELCKEYQRQ